MIDVILDTLLDVVKLLPFLFLAYLFMEFLEHHAGGKTERLLAKSGKIAPFFGGLLGLVPQCGFSAAASELYAGRLITTGTLIAVFLSTSDEMLPIMISHGVFPWKLLLSKMVVGILAGFLIDLIARIFCRKHPVAEETKIEDICEREHCQCGDHIALSALKHTLRIVVFLLIVTFLLNTVVHFVGEERLAALVGTRPILANLLSAIVGLIPNCASSVVLTELYLEGVLSVGALLSGLLVNAGVGLLVLFRNNRPVRDSFRIFAILFAVGLLAGLLVDLTPLAGILK
ncbi:MAG: hypothetical protein E7680_06060 [Ruminococcaceae bacterium]|nr:hypothetical protein [Oscillospiraceae bacterium]